MRLVPLLIASLAACLPTPAAPTTPTAPAAPDPEVAAGDEAPTAEATPDGAADGAADVAPDDGATPAAPTAAPAETPRPPTRMRSAAPPGALPALPALRTFRFAPTARKLIGGDGVAADGGCAAQIGADDHLGDLAVLATYYQNGCYTDGRYNTRGYLVEQGTVAASDGTTHAAYRLHPPTTAPSEFLGSHHAAYVRLAAAEDHTLYALEADSPVVVGEIAAAQITPGGWTRLPIDASTLGAPLTVFVAPRRQPVTALAALGGSVQGAQLPATALGTLALYRHATPGTPYDARVDGRGPDAPRGRRRLFPTELRDGGLAVVWQDDADQRVRVTQLARDLRTSREIVVDNPRRDILAAAASDGDRALYLFFVQPAAGGGPTTRAARLVRLDVATGERAERAADAGPAGLDITSFDDVASMAYDQGRVLLLLGRTMHTSDDGLNHQGGIAVEFDPRTLAVAHNFGQTSGHSFDNVLTAGVAPGELVGLDLGDNYPRGVHLHRFTGAGAARTHHAAIAYTFKTQHGTEPVAPDGRTHAAYDAISRGAARYYKWSNDNATYTELGGVVPTPEGYAIVFAGEAAGGRALDNARAGVPEPRDLGLVLVRRDFDALPAWGAEVPDAAVLTRGRPETGGFHAFGGAWTPQRNTGVVWLTQHRTPDRNATRVRVARLADGNALVLWEQWTRTAYVTTLGMKIDPRGAVLVPATDLGPRVRLGHRDDVLVRGDDVYIVTGRAAERAVEVIVLGAP